MMECARTNPIHPRIGYRRESSTSKIKEEKQTHGGIELAADERAHNPGIVGVAPLAQLGTEHRGHAQVVRPLQLFLEHLGLIRSPVNTSSFRRRAASYAQSRHMDSEIWPTILFVHVFTSISMAESAPSLPIETTPTRSLSHPFGLARLLITTYNQMQIKANRTSLNNGETTKSTHAGMPYWVTCLQRRHDVHVLPEIGNCSRLPAVVEEPSHSEQTNYPRTNHTMD